MQFSNLRPTDNATQLQKLGNLSYVVMGMYTEGGRTPYAMTVSANKLPGAAFINGNWWQGNPVGQSGYSLGVMQYDFGNFANVQNTQNFTQQVQAWAASQGKSLDAGSAANLAEQLAMRGGIAGQGLEVQGNWISANDRDISNGYTATNAGQTWVYNHLEVGNFTYNSAGNIVGGTGAVTQAVGRIQSALNTQYFQNLSASDQQQVEILLLKEANQTGNINPALTWLRNQGNSVGSANNFYTAMMIEFGGLPTGTELIKAWDASLSLQAVQGSPLFSPMWTNAQSKSLDAPTIVQDPESVALRALFTSQASSSTIRAITNKTPGTFSGDGKNGFIAVDSSGNVVVLQSAVSNGTADSNQNAPATALGWTLDTGGNWQSFSEGIGRGSQYIIQFNAKTTKWQVVAEANDGSVTPVVTLAENDGAQVNINGTDVTLNSSQGVYAFGSNGDLYSSNVSADGATTSGKILTGQYAGYLYGEHVGSGNAAESDPSMLYASYSPTGINNSTADKFLTLDDGKGNVTTIGRRTVIEGTQTIKTVVQNGVTVSEKNVFVSADQKTTTTNTTQRDPTTGAFVSHTIDTNSVDANGNPKSSEQGLDVKGAQISLSVTSLVNGANQTLVYGASDQLQSTTTSQTFDDGTALVTVKYPSGVQTVITTATDNSSKQVDYPNPQDPSVQTITLRDPSGAITSTETLIPLVDEHDRSIPNTYEIVVRDGSGTILDTGTRVVNPADGSHTDTLLGSATPANPALSSFAAAANEFNDANALIQAIQHHQPLPALGSGLRLYNDLAETRVPQLDGVGSAIGAFTSLQGLNAAFKHGDVTGAAVAGANLFVQGFNTYAIAAYGSVAKAAAQESLQSVAAAAEAVSDAIPYLSLANDLAHGNGAAAAGDAVGIVVVAELEAMKVGATVAGPIGALAGFIAGQIFSDIFNDGPPPPWGVANAYWDAASGTIRVRAQGDSGGDRTANNVLTSLVGSLQNVTVQYNGQAPVDLQIGVIPQRLGAINYGFGTAPDGTQLPPSFNIGTIDPATGQQLNPSLRFDQNTGQALDANVNDPAYFQTLGQYYINNALARQAIAPQWEVQTAQIQQANNLSNAGLGELERDANLGRLAPAPAAGATTEDWNPIGIDLGGGLAATSLANSATQFNVDGAADLDARLGGQSAPQFQKHTAWLNGQDGFLVLDKNLNGTIDNGEEMFSNSKVAEQARGIASLATWDANGDGIIDAGDPVFSQLRVWQDNDGNGRIEQGEARALGDLGITALNYRLGTYTKSDGSVHQMSTLTLQADTNGTAYQPHGDGIQITSTSGQTSLFVTQLHDLSSLQANEESFSTDENLSATIAVRGNGSTVQGLLDTVHVSNAPNALVKLTGVGNARHGAVSYDAQAGTVTFTPEGNYFGSDAGFDYQVDAGAYGQATAHVQVQVTHVEQPPHVTGEQNTPIPVYGYDITFGTGFDGNSIPTTIAPLYQPGYGFAGQAIDTSFAYRDRPVAYEADPYSGNIFASDSDDAPGALTWTVVHEGHHGHASVDGNGHWTFSNAQSIGGEDAFVVQVSDPGGRTDQIQINVPLPPPPTFGPPESGGEGAGAAPPIILDLNGTGFHFESVDDSNVFFDNAQDGWRHRTAWFGGGNGVLAYDKFGDGTVHDASQIDFKDLSSTAQTDLQGLAALDSNHDGVIDKADAAWNRLGVWVDADGDGISQPGEFNSLDARGITSIGLRSDNHFSVDHGVTVHGVTTFTRADGTSGQAADVTLPYSGDVLAPNADGTDRVTRVARADPGQPIMAGEGNRLVLGNEGDNTIIVGGGNNVVLTGAGNDLIQAGNGDNLIQSGDGRDLIGVGDGNNTVILGAGNKYVVAGKGNNLISGGSGNSIFFAGDGNNVMYAGSGNSLLRAGNGSNTLLGGAGHNELFAGNGNNIFNDGGGIADMYAGTGNNTFVVSNAHDTISVKAGGTNTVKTSIDWALGANQQILWGTGHDALTLQGNDLGDQIIGNGAADTLIGGAGNDTLADNGGAATLIGGGGNNTFVISNAATVVKADGDDEDTIRTSVDYTLPAGVKHLVGVGFGNLTLTGGPQDGVTVTANSGNDTLVAGSGTATLIGGSGNDTFVVNNSADVVRAQALGNINTVLTSVSYTAPANVQFLTGTGTADLTLAGGSQDITIRANDGNDTLIAGSGNDTLIAGAGHDTMIGGVGADTYQLFNGTDTIRLGSGASKVMGGNANVTLTGNASGTSVITLGDGSSLIDLSANNNANRVTLGNGGNTVKAGNGANSINGGNGANTISLGSGSNAVALGNGTNSVTAGNGANNIRVGSGPDTIGLGDGNNSVIAADATGVTDTIQLGNGANVVAVGQGNNRISFGNGANALTGGDGANVVAVGAGANSIKLGNGNNQITTTDVTGITDTIRLGHGNNRVQVGQGDDRIELGSGSNTVIGGNGTISVELGSGSNAVTLGNGNNRITAADTNGSRNVISLGGGANTLTLGDGANTVRTGDGDSAIQAGNGSNSITVGAGRNNIVMGNGANIVAGGSGANTVRAGSGGGSITFGDGGNSVTTTDIAVVAETISLGNGSNLVRVGDGNDRITLGNGASTVNGGNGADSVFLGSGSNSVALGDGNNTVSAHDQAGSANTFTLGNGDNNVTAGNGVDSVKAGDGANTVALGSGQDTVTLGNGNNKLTTADAAGVTDTIQLGDGNNQIQAGQGNDQIVLGNGFNTVKTGDGSSSIRAGNGNNAISVGAGSNSITLGDGANTVTGGSGSNTINAGSGRDSITLGDGDNRIHVGDGDDAITLGNGSNVVLSGNGNNTITAGDGVDTVALGTGSNNVTLGNGNDTVTAQDVAGSASKFTLGNGRDSLTLGNGANTVVLGSGQDAVTLGNGNNSVTTADVAGVADTIRLGNGNNRVRVGDGNDQIQLGNGNSTVNGGNGADVVSLGTGSNSVTLGNGNDVVTAQDGVGASNRVTLGNGTDLVTLGNGNDVVSAGDGNDRITLGDGNNIVSTGDGNSQVKVGNGRNSVTVGNGNNSLITGNGVNALHVGIGNDTVTNQAGTDTLYFSPTVKTDNLNFFRTGADVMVTETITGGSVRILGAAANPANGIAQFIAGDGAYTVHFDDGAYNFAAGNGNDAVYGNAGIYHVNLGNGNDLVQFGDGNDSVVLGNGNSQVTVGNGNDLIAVGDGNNQIRFGNGNDSITAGDGSNTIVQQGILETPGLGQTSVGKLGGANVVVGNGANTVTLGDGNDSVTVGNGNNTVTLGDGANQIVTGSGKNAIRIENGQYAVTNHGGTDLVYLSPDKDHDELSFAVSGQDLVMTEHEGATVRMLGGNAPTATGMTQIVAGDSATKVSFDGGSYSFAAGKGNNQVSGGDGNDTVTLGNGNNHIQLGNGNDQVTVGAGKNAIVLGNGNDTVTLGAGNQTLTLGNGFDSIRTNGGKDVITLGRGQYALANAGAQDSVALTAGAYDKLWFQQQGNDLVMTVLGSSEKLMVLNWFTGGAGAQLTKLTSSDGRSISSADITKLVQSMAAFFAPTAGQLSYTPQEQKALAPLLASAWHRS